MKKVLIFTASTGGGHNQAATSLEREFKLKGYEAVKVDMLKETSRMLDILIADGYKVLATKMPKIYGGLYKWSDSEKVNNGITKSFAKLACREIKYIIDKNNPDLIIGTHPFIIDVIGKFKGQDLLRIPFISIVTDYEAHQTYVSKSVDAYITGSEHTSQSLVNKGVSRDKLYPFGIPIRREFLEEKKELCQETDKTFQILIMGGSMGVKSIKKVLKSLTKSTHSFRVVVVCGKDEVLRKSLEKGYEDKIKDKKLIVYGFTRKIAKLMDSSNIIITKPGGLTVSESIARNIPMIIPYLIPGQEAENAEFLVREGIAVRVDQIKDIQFVVEELIDNPQKLYEMKDKMKGLVKQYSLDNIIGVADKLIKEYKFKWGLTYEQN